MLKNRKEVKYNVEELSYETFDDLVRDSSPENVPYKGDVAMLLRLADKATANSEKDLSNGFEEKSGSVHLNSFDKVKLDKYYYRKSNQDDSDIDYSTYKGAITLVDKENQVVYNFSYEPPKYKGRLGILYVNAVRVPVKIDNQNVNSSPIVEGGTASEAGKNSQKPRQHKIHQQSTNFNYCGIRIA
ncbi:hypothetical protein EVA_00733 [gut metagenome]|uniref:Uncharacterized protein n=1 Tax=gut metagenome TaxID=749906 RepID=J9H3U4_9ZZZZ